MLVFLSTCRKGERIILLEKAVKQEKCRYVIKTEDMILTYK